MKHIIPLPVATAENVRPLPVTPSGASTKVDAVYVLFTSVDETFAAVRAVDLLARALRAPLTVIHFRRVPFPLPVDRPAGISPVETENFASRLHAAGIHARIRVYLCRDERRMLPLAFKKHSLVVFAGRHSWWPTRLERLRRTLEAAGHLVVFVETPNRSVDVARDEEACRA